MKLASWDPPARTTSNALPGRTRCCFTGAETNSGAGRARKSPSMITLSPAGGYCKSALSSRVLIFGSGSKHLARKHHEIHISTGSAAARGLHDQASDRSWELRRGVLRLE